MEKQNINFFLPKELHQRLKLVALKQGVTMGNITEQALEKELTLREQEIKANDRNKRK